MEGNLFLSCILPDTPGLWVLCAPWSLACPRARGTALVLNDLRRTAWALSVSSSRASSRSFFELSRLSVWSSPRLPPLPISSRPCAQAQASPLRQAPFSQNLHNFVLKMPLEECGNAVSS